MQTFRPRTIAEYLRALWHRLPVLIFVSVIMLSATIPIIRRLPDRYESVATLRVASQQYGELSIGSAQLSAAVQQLTSRSRFESLIDRYDLYPELPGIEQAVARLSRDLRLETKMRGYYPDAPESVSLSFRYTNPKLAQQVLTDLLSTFEQMNVAVRREAEAEEQRLTARISEVETQLVRLNQQRVAQAQANQAGRNPLNAAAVQSQRQALTAAIESLNDRKYLLEQQLDGQQKLVADQQKLVRTTSSQNDARNGGAQGALLVRRAQLEAQLRDYSTQFTEKNPKVIQARSELTEINRQLTQMEATRPTENNPAGSPEARELRGLQQELTRLQAELTITQRDLARKQNLLSLLPHVSDAPALAAPAAVADSSLSGNRHEVSAADSNAVIPASASQAEYSMLLSRYDALLNKQDSLRRAQVAAAGLGPELFRVVDAPSYARLPQSPNRMFLSGLALTLSLLVALSVVVMLELPKFFQVRDEQDVEYFLDAPVLALLPETQTSRERARHQRLRLLGGLGVLLLGMTMIPVLTRIISLTGVFQLLGNR